MVALVSKASEFEKCNPEGDVPTGADLGKFPAIEKASTAADDSSSSQSSGGATGECPVGALAAGNVPGRVRRKVSFQIDEGVNEPRGTLRPDITVGKAANSHVGAARIDADLKVFCVHCGKQVPSEILRVGTSFCTYCGQRHPENLMSWASGSHKVPTLSEEHVRLHDEADWRAKIVQPCSAQVAPTANRGQVGMQQVPWNNGGQRLHAMPHLGHQVARADQCRPSSSEPAYVHCGQLAL